MKRKTSILAKDSPKHILRPTKQNKGFFILLVFTPHVPEFLQLQSPIELDCMCMCIWVISLFDTYTKLPECVDIICRTS